jgi:hypothetical protein
MYNDSELRESNSYLKSIKTERKSFARHLTTFEQTLLKVRSDEMMLLRRHFSVTV